MSGLDYVAAFTRADSAAKKAGGDRLRLVWAEDAWSKLLARTEPQGFRAGDILIQRGAADRALCLIAAGAAEIGLSRPSEGVAPIARAAAGDVIGEQSFFDAQPRSMNVWAVSDGVLLRLAPEAFDAFGREEPALARDLLFAVGRVLSLRLRQSTKA